MKAAKHRFRKKISPLIMTISLSHYDKLGKQDEAIETIREKAEKLPNVGEYETHANLGTFLVHAGKYEEGLADLRKAIEINPDAHFGREQYQVSVVEYVSEHRGDASDATLPLEGSFAWWLLEREGLGDGKGTITDEKAARAELDRAAKGILGMMRFGDFRSPILLEVLGDVLLSGRNYHDANESQRLAARAYLRAAEFSEGSGGEQGISRNGHNAAHESICRSQCGRTRRVAEGGQVSLASLEDQLAREVKEADAWFKEVAHDEELWVEASPDPDQRFWEKYGNQTITVGHDRLPAGKFAAEGLSVVLRIALGVGLVITVLAVIGAMAWRKRRPTGYTVGERQA